MNVQGDFFYIYTVIQRIQTIYLFLALVAILAIYAFPILIVTSFSGNRRGNMEMTQMQVFAYQRTSAMPIPLTQPLSPQWFYPNLALLVVSGLTMLVSIFLFRFRRVQIGLCWLGIGLMLILSFFVYRTLQDPLPAAGNRTLGIGAYSISASILLMLMARRQIQKDENLVQSSSRLR